jgi:hypothetical protein
VSEQACREKENPSELLKRVYDIFIYIHITVTSPESKYENDDDAIFCNSFLKIVKAKVVKN